MPDDDVLHTPLPDVAHEGLRVAVLQALENLAATTVNVTQLQELSDQYRSAVQESIEDRMDLRQRVESLEAAVQALTGATA